MSQPPARGARHGVKQDIQAAKNAGAGYEAGAGTSAWSHDFLNKKPWHPANFRNQLRKWEAEQAEAARLKREETAAAEFDAEQRYLDTLAALPSEAAEKYRQRQQVSWMYVKPPGMAAAEEGRAEPAPAQAGVAVLAGGPPARGEAGRDGRQGGREPAHRPQGGELTYNVAKRKRSPPRGGFSAADTNQQFLGDDDDDDEHARHVAALAAALGSADGARKTDKRAGEGKAKRRDKEKYKERDKNKRRSKDKHRKSKRHKEDKQDDDKLRNAIRLLLEEGYSAEQLPGLIAERQRPAPS